MERIIALANDGQIEAAEARYAQFAHPKLLSGHDRQKCEQAIRKAKERASEQAALKRQAKPRKRAKRRTKN